MNRGFVLFFFICTFGYLMGQETLEDDPNQAGQQTTGITALPSKYSIAIGISNFRMTKRFIDFSYFLQATLQYPIAC